MKHGFVRLAAAVPEIQVASPLYNKVEICSVMDAAYAAGVHVLTFPELSLTGAACGDLFFSEKLLQDAETALLDIAAYSAGKQMLTFVGAPVRCGSRLYNCAAAVCDGRIVRVIPKKILPASGDLDQARHFSVLPAEQSVSIGGQDVLLTDTPLLCDTMPGLAVGCLIGEDFTTAAADRLASHGANVLVHLSASAEIIGREDWRRTLAKAVSGRLICACVSADAGDTESSTDMVFGGHCIVAENGAVLAERLPFGDGKLLSAVVDVQHLHHDRMKNTAFAMTPASGAAFSLRSADTDLTGVIDPCPFLPASSDPAAVCARILEIQSRGLARRLTAAHASGAVIALSGGLDSTLALIATVCAMDLLGRDRRDILSVTMPCFGTTGRTRGNAEELALQFGTDFRCVDIKEAVDLHFRDIGHDSADLSVVYENAQARERTQIIMDIANGTGALVIGTGDLSELALGWATYNGDHMSNYGTNGGIPKTLVRHVVRYYADSCEEQGQTRLAAVLRDILATPV
ncbi:MAG: NAD(+) synthase, partial [Clostridia bacterium]|nr:NAD(+) synthase [Clostridia bacterium]